MKTNVCQFNHPSPPIILTSLCVYFGSLVNVAQAPLNVFIILPFCKTGLKPIPLPPLFRGACCICFKNFFQKRGVEKSLFAEGGSQMYFLKRSGIKSKSRQNIGGSVNQAFTILRFAWMM